MMTPQQSASILSRMYGYNGPADQDSVNQFLSANPAAAARMGKYKEAMSQMLNGRTMSGFANGGQVPRATTIAGQPHHLAYINPQEARMLKNAGGAGLPGPGGIPAYFTLDPNADIGTTAVDPNTGETYTKTADGWSGDGAGQTATGDTSGATGGTDNLGQGVKDLMAQALQPIPAPASVSVGAPGQISAGTGQAGPAATAATATVTDIAQAEMPDVKPAQTYDAVTVGDQVQEELSGLEAVTGQVPTEAIIEAEQQTETAVSDMKAAQGEAILMENPVTLDVQDGELVSGSSVDASRVNEHMESIQAATATLSKKATVQGQLEDLMAQFESKNPPAWASGAMRAANQAMVARGLGASSLAGQAIVQSAMESALPIAIADAQAQATIELQNLSNRQQRAMLVAEQRAAFLGQEFTQEFQARVQNAARVAEVANLNFSAEQTIALENSRAVNTMNLQNLTNRQAMIMAEAAALSNLEVQNLNNRQQAAVQNAQNFLQMEMQNLSNQQQTSLFKAQQSIQALFTDQAAVNAAAQFNASSENQVNMFFAELQAQTSQFNASQTNAIRQFNAGQTNAVAMFNAEAKNQREMFNASQALTVAQANAQWRNTAAIANAQIQADMNMQAAKTQAALSMAALDQIWQRERDIMSYAFTAKESALDRELQLVLGEMDLTKYREAMASQEDSAKWQVLSDGFFSLWDS